MSSSSDKPAPTLKSLIYKSGNGTARSLQVLDQLKLPHETVYIDIPHVQAAFDVIKKMQIRGESHTRNDVKEGVEEHV